MQITFYAVEIHYKDAEQTTSRIHYLYKGDSITLDEIVDQAPKGTKYIDIVYNHLITNPDDPASFKVATIQL